MFRKRNLTVLGVKILLVNEMGELGIKFLKAEKKKNYAKNIATLKKQMKDGSTLMATPFMMQQALPQELENLKNG